MIDVVWHSR